MVSEAQVRRISLLIVLALDPDPTTHFFLFFASICKSQIRMNIIKTKNFIFLVDDDFTGYRGKSRSC